MFRRLLPILTVAVLLFACDSTKSPASSSSSNNAQGADVVSQEFRHLLPMAQRWGIRDDDERSELTDKVTPSEKQALQDAVGPYRQQINSWLDSYDQKPMPEEAAAFMYMLLAMEEMDI